MSTILMGKETPADLVISNAPVADAEGAIEPDVGLADPNLLPASADEGREAPKTTKQKIITYARLLTPHVSLVAFLVLYLLVGATVFHYIEAPNELETRERQLHTLRALRDSFHNKLWNLMYDSQAPLTRTSLDSIGEEYFEALAVNFLDAYRKQLFTDERHLLNRTNSDEPRLWSFANSVFFSTTMITTIGYGNLMPATDYGRIFCIFFAIFGIPLLLITISDIGKFLSELLNYFYISCRRKFKNRRGKRSQECAEELEYLRFPIIMVLALFIGYCVLGALLFKIWEGWTFFKAFYFCFVTLSTIGFGGIVPIETSILVILGFVFVGLCFFTLCSDLAGTEYIRTMHRIGRRMTFSKKVVKTNN